MLDLKQTRIFFLTCIMLSLVLLGSSIGMASDYELPSLREIYKDYFYIGGAVSVASWAPKTLVSHREIIEGQLNSLTAENAMKPDYLQPREGVFNFVEPDKMVAFAQEHGMQVRGHTLVWHAQTPDWFFRDKSGKRIDEKDVVTEEDRQLVIERLEAHIEAVMNHFGDKVYVWDVANEVVTDDAGRIHRLDSPWIRTIGEDFIKIAFRKAREVNPDIGLFYNDYNAVAPYKRGRIISMLKDMINDGVPIDGMGIQAHWGVDGPSIGEIEDALKMYADLGLEIHITEMDVGIGNFTEEQQAERYREIFRLFKKYSDVVTNVTLWGVADDASWRGDDDPLLFNRDHEPKPAFWAIVDTERPWYVNKAEYTGAAFFRTEDGQKLGTLLPGKYLLEDLDFNLEQAREIEIVKGHFLSFYENQDFSGEAWHFTSAEDFNGAEMARQAKSFTIRYIDANNVALDKPTKASELSERAPRAVDGDGVSSWSPKGGAPYWLEVDLEDVYMLNRWVVKLQGTGPLAGNVANSPFNAADFELQISEDGIDWETVDVVEDNTLSTADRDLSLIPARHVRLFVTKPTSLDSNKNLIVYELEVYGISIE